MMSYRIRESGIRWRTHAVACLAAFALLPTATPCRAQSAVGLGSTVVAPRDSSRADSSRADNSRVDSSRVDSSRVDSSRVDSSRVDSSRVDSTRQGGALAPGHSTAPSAPAAPADSALGAACRDSGGASPDLLMVRFSPSATESERAAVAQEVGGTLVATSEQGPPGSWYIRVPGSAVDRSVADRLIVLSPVLEVESTRCPS